MFYQSGHFSFFCWWFCIIVVNIFLFFNIIIIFWISEIERHSTCGTELPCNLWVFWINLVWLKWKKKKKKKNLFWAIRVYLQFTCGSSVDTFLGVNMCKFLFFISFFLKQSFKSNYSIFIFSKTVASCNTHAPATILPRLLFTFLLVLKSKKT